MKRKNRQKQAAAVSKRVRTQSRVRNWELTPAVSCWELEDRSLVDILNVGYAQAVACKKVLSGLSQFKCPFSEQELQAIESRVDALAKTASEQPDSFRSCTLDKRPLRTKMFFGFGYTYGGGLGSEQAIPSTEVDPIPSWMTELIIRPLEEKNIIPKGFVNSIVLNDYQAQGCIVSHVDPKHLFERPIVSLSLFSSGVLSFDCRFSFQPIRVSNPVLRLAMPRGCVTVMQGYAADEVTHCVAPDDTTARRVSLILRKVKPSAAAAAAQQQQEQHPSDAADEKQQPSTGHAQPTQSEQKEKEEAGDRAEEDSEEQLQEHNEQGTQERCSVGPDVGASSLNTQSD